MRKKHFGGTTTVILVGVLVVALILILGTVWMGQSASRDTEKAVRSVSLLYLDELAGRREQVVSNNLNSSISNMRVAIGLMTEEDLSDMAHLQTFQAKMKQLYTLDKFAFVDTNGLIYTSLGTQTDIADYHLDYLNLTEPSISIKNVDSPDKKVIIAVPLDGIPFNGETLVVCFMEIDMARMLEGVSMRSSNTDATFCNIYTSTGIALTNVILGGLSEEANLLDALARATFEDGYSYEEVVRDFAEGNKGVASFTYNGILETSSYTPVEGTDWMLTYLIRESLVSEQISSISDGTVRRSLIQSALTAVVMIAMFSIIMMQNRKSAQLQLAKETSEAESRAKQEGLERQLAIEVQMREQDSMITALASDYRSVYWVSLDADEGICYRSDVKDHDALKPGEHFTYLSTFRQYAEDYVDEADREAFLTFIEPDTIRRRLEKEVILVCRYLVHKHGHDSYEMLRIAGVRHAEDRDDHIVHAIGIGFTDIDRDMRESLAKNRALSDALTAAENASKAKTSFLSSMSHEIRTPMNAIISLDNIALNDAEVNDKSKEYFSKINNSAEHLLTLINDILDMSRIESGRMTLKNEEFSFSKLLEQINTIFSGQCAEKGLIYNCQMDSVVDDYYIGDSIKLRQVLINILGNAVKFTPEGSVSMQVTRTAQYEGKSTLRFIISDTGIGMNESYLPHIFDTFSQEDSSTTNRYGSSGLGLAITKNIVEMMNGTIEVQSQKHVGTTFTVMVTLMDADRHPSAAEENLQPHDISVLVIDDDPIACEHARLVLEKIGIACEIAQSGREAIDMVRLRHARRDPYNLILVDWKMPDMDGVETTRQIRAIIGNQSAIIILTAYRWDDVQDEALDAGVDSFISKPLFASNVLEEFTIALKRKNLLAIKRERKADLTGRRILVAEDMEINAEIMVMVLKMRDMEAELAGNGRIAVDMFAAHPEGYYDAILMDMRMPEMDGLEATATIRAMDRPDAKTIPIIALTANAFDEDVQRSLQAGLNAHLSKPVEPDVLFETLESLIKA